MAFSLGSARPARLGLAFASLALVVSSCVNLTPQDLRVPKLYVQDYSLSVSAQQISGLGSDSFVQAQSKAIQSLGKVGVLFSPNYIFTADPVLTIAATEPVAMPDNAVVDETTTVNGQQVTQKVLRKPIFFIDSATITYQLEGVAIAPTTLQLQVPIKSNSLQLPVPGVAQVQALMNASSANPASVSLPAGTVTVALAVRDLDPLAAERNFTVQRTLPFSYRYTTSRPETTASAAPSEAPSGAPSATPTPSASPSHSPSPSPSPSPSASPSPSPRAS